MTATTPAGPATEIYVDPVCPFAWVTSRWLDGVSLRRGVSVEWRQMSLSTLNEGHTMSGAHAERMVASRRAGRVFAAAAELAPMKDLYLAFGRRLHADERSLTTELMREALSECGLDPALAGAMGDPRYDDAVAAAHERSQTALGGTGGSPIVVIDGRAFFGPVLTEIPDPQSADRLFDGLAALAAIPAFAQVERPRVGQPNVKEAA